MRKSILAACILLTAFAIPAVSLAQEKDKPAEAAKPAEPVHYYRLTLIVQDVDSAGKPINSRSYVTTISTAQPSAPASIRTGSRVPIPAKDSQFTYLDIGINFDVRSVHEIDRELGLWVGVDISSYMPTENSAVPPIIRHNKWEAPVLIPIGKPTVIFSSDSLESKNAMQVVAIVAPIS